MSQIETETETETERSFGTGYVLVVALCMFSLGAIVGVNFYQFVPTHNAPYYENHKMGDVGVIKFFYEGGVYYNTWDPRGLWSDSNGDMVARFADFSLDQDDLNVCFDEILRRDKALRLVEAAGN